MAGTIESAEEEHAGLDDMMALEREAMAEQTVKDPMEIDISMDEEPIGVGEEAERAEGRGEYDIQTKQVPISVFTGQTGKGMGAMDRFKQARRGSDT